jgi:putative Holliday junction resolvase
MKSPSLTNSESSFELATNHCRKREIQLPDPPLNPTPDSVAPLPPEGRLAGIDFGTVRIGIAISDPSQKWSSPLETYQVRNKELDAQFFVALADRESLTGWVIGLPLHTSGQPSKKSNQAVKFGQWIAASTSLPVDWIDERFTTAAAREMLGASSMSGKKKKANLDKIAAQVILATYLDSDRTQKNKNHSLED